MCPLVDCRRAAEFTEPPWRVRAGLASQSPLPRINRQLENLLSVLGQMRVRCRTGGDSVNQIGGVAQARFYINKFRFFYLALARFDSQRQSTTCVTNDPRW